jgi:[ribosomal protein S18]-alanine N-acetyltransferase
MDFLNLFRPTCERQKMDEPRSDKEPVISWMIRANMPSVLAIENTVFSHPWSEDDFIACLRQRNCIGLVAKIDDIVVGYVIYELHKNRLHLLNMAVVPGFWKMGAGTALINKLKAKLNHDRRNRIVLEVRETNLHAQLFFKRHGFMAISVLKGFYPDGKEDAYLFQYRHVATQAEIDSINQQNRMTRMQG